MIKHWRLHNFKSVRAQTELEFAPITLFAGANSSGKSTMIQAILMLCQTLASKVPSRSVVLNGHILRLGSFDDLRSFNSELSAIGVGATLEPHPRVREGFYLPTQVGASRAYMFRSRRVGQLQSVSFDLAFDAAVALGPGEISQLQPKLQSCAVSATLSGEEDTEESVSLEVTRSHVGIEERVAALHLADAPNAPNLFLSEGLEYNVNMDVDSSESIRQFTPTNEPVGCVLNHFLPNFIVVRFDERDEAARIVTESLIEPRSRPSSLVRPQALPRELMPFLRERLGERFPGRRGTLFGGTEDTDVSTLQEWASVIQRLRLDERAALRSSLREMAADIRGFLTREGPNYLLGGVRPPDELLEAVEFLNYYFISSVKYLGPLREEPRPLYPLVGSTDPADVGMKGEFTAAVLDVHRNVRVEYVPPGGVSGETLDGGTLTRPLHAAVLDWLQYLGVVHELSARDLGKLGHELKVKTNSTDLAHDITHVGVGVSQVLPIVVMCLIANKDATLILEQPELHLHPRVQTRLGDFFLSVALGGKQCIVETHSEYLINRIRLRIASAREDSLGSLVRMYFVGKEAGSSVYRPVRVNRYGAIQDWPDGFFDESQREAEEIIRAAIAKKREERRGNDA